MPFNHGLLPTPYYSQQMMGNHGGYNALPFGQDLGMNQFAQMGGGFNNSGFHNPAHHAQGHNPHAHPAHSSHAHSSHGHGLSSGAAQGFPPGPPGQAASSHAPQASAFSHQPLRPQREGERSPFPPFVLSAASMDRT
jgi:hypothetical protein